jgi:ABC-type sugar transport system ATPase subunit
VAAFIGTPPMNLLPARWQDDALEMAGTAVPVERRSATPREVLAGVRPGELRIAPTGIPARVELVEDLGDSNIVDLLVGEQRVKLKGDRIPPVAEGDEVRLDFAPSAVHLFDRQTGARI